MPVVDDSRDAQEQSQYWQLKCQSKCDEHLGNRVDVLLDHDRRRNAEIRARDSAAQTKQVAIGNRHGDTPAKVDATSEQPRRAEYEWQCQPAFTRVEPRRDECPQLVERHGQRENTPAKNGQLEVSEEEIRGTGKVQKRVLA